MYEIVICDDDAIFIKYMKRMLLEAGMNSETVNFYEYQSGEQLLAVLPKHTAIDLLVLDMQMKELDGNQTAKGCREQFPSAILVFCSGVCQPTVKSFEVLPYRYLLKEYTDTHMLEEVKTMVNELKKRAKEIFIIGHYYQNAIRLKPEEILYISIEKHGSQIHINPQVIGCRAESKILCKQKVEELYDKLKDHNFAYAHNSYIVNSGYVKQISAAGL